MNNHNLPSTLQEFDNLPQENRESFFAFFLSLPKQLLELGKQIEELNRKIEILEAQLGKNSSNSSKPPSSDGFKKTSVKSLWKKSGKKQGGQKGHIGKGMALCDRPDDVLQHLPSDCENSPLCCECGQKFFVSGKCYTVDIEVKRHITDHQKCNVFCPFQGRILKGEFPVGISGTKQYGNGIRTLAILLAHYGIVSYHRVHKILSAITGWNISTGFVANIYKQLSTSKALMECNDRIAKGMLDAMILHADETGIRSEGKLHWLHNVSNEEYTQLSVSSRRGIIGIEESGILPLYQGTLVHDCWRPYWRLENIQHHSICLAHILRELRGLYEGYSQKWAKELYRYILTVKRRRDKAIEKGHKKFYESTITRIVKGFDTIVAKAFQENTERRKGDFVGSMCLALARRLLKRKEEVLRFVKDFFVPFTNNRAETDLRMSKTKMKVIGTFRTKAGADNYAILQSYLSTAQKHGTNIFQAIKLALLGCPEKAIWSDD